MLTAALIGGSKAPPPLVFPVVGPVSYTNDFGDPRSGGTHQGNDLMAPKKALAVAVESGTVKFWTTSASAGCMLYLNGDSGTQYLYIHLNNDLTAENDNQGKCVAGVSYAVGLKDGARVAAGQQVGFVGDSGDANGIASHLHFEVHPGGKKAVSPFPYLQKARHLLFAARPGSTFSLVLHGTVSAVGDGSVDLDVSLLQMWPLHLRLKSTGLLTIADPDGVAIDALPGQKIVLWTTSATATLDAELGLPLALTAARLRTD